MTLPRSIAEPAPAKLNLALHVRRRRADGYHDIETIFAFCRHGDVVTVTPAAADTFVITGPFAAALDADAEPSPRDANLVTRAADVFRHAFDIAHNHTICLQKNLPVASGIGGGSADAAATLRALSKLYGIKQNEPQIVEIARNLGADVSACLKGITAYGSGRGDMLAPIRSLAEMPVLLVNPGVAISTAAVFARWDGIDRGPLDADDPAAGRNDLEAPARALAPVIDEVLAMLAARPGATLVRMSGSGATCFAMFGRLADRDAAAAAITRDRPDWWQLASTLG